MPEFTPINTQEEFEAAVEAAYGNVKDLQQQITTLTGERDTHAAQLANLQKEVDGYKLRDTQRRIALDKGIPAELADRITGSDEEAMKADADRLLGVIRGIRGPAPLAEPGSNAGKEKDAALREVLQSLKGV